MYKKKNHIITIYEFMSPFSINSACHKLVEKHLNGDRYVTAECCNGYNCEA